MRAENGEGRPNERKQDETKRDERDPSHMPQALPEFVEGHMRAMIVAGYRNVDTGKIDVLQGRFVRDDLIQTAWVQGAMVMPRAFYRHMSVGSETQDKGRFFRITQTEMRKHRDDEPQAKPRFYPAIHLCFRL